MRYQFSNRTNPRRRSGDGAIFLSSEDPPTGANPAGPEYRGSSPTADAWGQRPKAAHSISQERELSHHRECMKEEMQVCNLTPHTRKSYINLVSLFAALCARLSPEQFGQCRLLLATEEEPPCE